MDTFVVAAMEPPKKKQIRKIWAFVENWLFVELCIIEGIFSVK